MDVEVAGRAGWHPMDLARAYLNGGARFLQLRAKAMTGAALLELSRELVALGRPYAATIVINDRVDIAAIAAADGVHVGQEDLPPDRARRVVGSDALIGRSTHTDAQLDAAATEPIDYVAIGPVFGTSTKATGFDAVGLEMIRRATRVGRPVVAIGGVTIDNARSALDAGAACVAVISDLLASGDPERRVRQYLQMLE